MDQMFKVEKKRKDKLARLRKYHQKLCIIDFQIFSELTVKRKKTRKTGVPYKTVTPIDYRSFKEKEKKKKGSEPEEVRSC